MAVQSDDSVRQSAHDERSTDPVNLILYGPPGTGKTYHSAYEAVKLCDGFAPKDRTALMQRYRELSSSRRIAFVTFHQSYSYEDFVEGLRPSSGGEDDDDERPTGFSLKPEDGVFKQIADLARNNRGTPSVRTDRPLDRTQKVAKMSLGRSSVAQDDYIFEDAIAGGYVVLGWGGNIDWSDARYDDSKEIKERWLQVQPDATSNNPNISMLWYLRVAMKLGSLVVISDGRNKFRAVGQITGPYYYEEGPAGNHRRPVKWLWHSEDGLARELIYPRPFSQGTIYHLDSKVLDWDALEQIIAGNADTFQNTGKPDSFVLIIDEINRANISKVFGELITLIEPDKRSGKVNALSVTLPYSKTSFSVPANLNIVGTMNTADRSIALLDTALRRRFRFTELMPDASLLGVVDGIDVGVVLTNLNSRIEYLIDRDHQIGHAYFIDCASRAALDQAMRTSVIPLLAEYFYDDWEKVREALGESIDDGSFVSRTRLPAPHGVELNEDGTERWRYTIKTSFKPNAFDQLS